MFKERYLNFLAKNCKFFNFFWLFKTFYTRCLLLQTSLDSTALRNPSNTCRKKHKIYQLLKLMLTLFFEKFLYIFMKYCFLAEHLQWENQLIFMGEFSYPRRLIIKFCIKLKMHSKIIGCSVRDFHQIVIFLEFNGHFS